MSLSCFWYFCNAVVWVACTIKHSLLPFVLWSRFKLHLEQYITSASNIKVKSVFLTHQSCSCWLRPWAGHPLVYSTRSRSSFSWTATSFVSFAIGHLKQINFAHYESDFILLVVYFTLLKVDYMRAQNNNGLCFRIQSLQFLLMGLVPVFRLSAVLFSCSQCAVLQLNEWISSFSGWGVKRNE